MASISISPLPFLSFVNASATSTSSSSSLFPLSRKPCLASKHRKPKCYHASKVVACKGNQDINPTTNSEEGKAPQILGNRRNVLICIGGLYGAATLSNNPLAFAAPVSSPELTSRGPPDLPAGAKSTNCCPPSSTKIIDFKPPSSDQPLMVRPAAHLVSDDYLAFRIDTRKIGYVYQDVDIPWLKAKPTPRRSKVQKVSQHFGVGAAQAAETSRARNVKFPLILDSIVSTVVKRPKKSRSKKEKEEEEEVLTVDGIEFDRNSAVKFDVFINDEDDKLIRPDNTEFAGSFVSVPHTHKHKNKKINTCLRLGLTDLLEDLGAEDDDSVVVTLVRRYGKGLVKIGGMKIELED